MRKRSLSYALLFLVLAFAPGSTRAQAETIYVPDRCREDCSGAKLFEVKSSAENFLSIDQNATSSSFVVSRASTWGVALLKLVRSHETVPGDKANAHVRSAVDQSAYAAALQLLCISSITSNSSCWEWAGSLPCLHTTLHTALNKQKRHDTSHITLTSPVVAWLQVREAVVADPRRQNVTITPPAVARLLGGYSLAVYQAFAVWSEYLYSYGEWGTAASMTCTIFLLAKQCPCARQPKHSVLEQNSSSLRHSSHYNSSCCSNCSTARNCL
jgi:hypothetical protein